MSYCRFGSNTEFGESEHYLFPVELDDDLLLDFDCCFTMTIQEVIDFIIKPDLDKIRTEQKLLIIKCMFEFVVDYKKWGYNR